jgi:putative salt-induced outer membrane protein YdiY
LAFVAGSAGAHDPEAPKAPPPGLFGTSFLEGWYRSIGAGIAGSEGNSKTFDFNVDLLGDAENEVRRWKLRSAYYLSSADDEGTKNQAYLDLTRDFLFTGWPLFLFANGRYDYDKFEEWDHRVALYGGVGYGVLDYDTFDLRARLGAGASQTFGAENGAGGEADDFRYESLAGIDAEWVPREGQKFSTSHTIYPDWSDVGEFRTLSTADWIIAVSDWIPLALKLGAVFEHESKPVGGAKKDDLKYLASLLYTF